MKVKVKAVVSGTTRPMKDSGVDWIGIIPEKWSVYPARFAFLEEKTKNVKGTIKHALKFFNGTIIPKDGFDADYDEYVAETISNYTVVKPNTIMINGLNLNYDLKSLRVGLVNELGVITSAYLALIPDTSRILPTYATYLFKGYEAKMAFHNMGSGIRKTLGFKEFKHQPILMPPLEEQAIISNYLDKECARIDSVIEKTRESIEEYKKLKQSIITEAVTKGIQPNRKLKDSGLVWIGEIADGFEMKKLKYLCDILDQFRSPITADQRNQDADILYDYYGASGAIDKIDGYTIDDHVMLIGEDGANLRMRNLPLMYEVDGKAWINNHAHILKPKDNVDYYYLFYALEALDINTYITGSAQPKLSQDNLRRIWVPIPTFSEQKEISEFLKVIIKKLDHIIETKRKFLLELEAYKQSVIFECVTGKREVV